MSAGKESRESLKVVLDTNVIVSALMSPLGNPAKILELFFDEKLHAYYSGDILAEYEDVLSRPALKIEPQKKRVFFEVIREIGILTEPTASTMKLPDESDRVFYDTAKTSGSILITGNIKHYPLEKFIITPSQFLEKFTTC